MRPRHASYTLSRDHETGVNMTLSRATFKSTLAVVAFFALFAGTAQGATVVRWTPAQAAAKIKATYTTVDPTAYAVVEANIRQQLAGGKAETDPVIISLRASLEKTKHAAKATSAACRGAGVPVSGRYSRFRCTVQVAGTFRAPPDYQTYSAVKRVTARLVGSRLVVS